MPHWDFISVSGPALSSMPQRYIFCFCSLFSSLGLCLWRAYVVTQSLASVSALVQFQRLSVSAFAQCLSFQRCATGELHCLLATLVMPGHTIMAVYFCCSAVHLFLFSFLDDNLSKYQWIFTKLGICTDIVKILFGIANFVNFWQLSAHHMIVAVYYCFVFLFTLLNKIWIHHSPYLSVLTDKPVQSGPSRSKHH